MTGLTNTTSTLFQQLLLDEVLSSEQATALLRYVSFSDWRLAVESLRRMARHADEQEALAGLLPTLLSALATAPDPDDVLARFERFASAFENRAALYAQLLQYPRSVEVLATLFAASHFLTEILLSHPHYFRMLLDRKDLAEAKSLDRFTLEAWASTEMFSDIEGQLDALRRFQRRELLRIGAGDLLDLLDLSTAINQLSHLAEALIRVCLDLAVRQVGLQSLDGFVVIALGKLGGEELNYSSDIDLVFLCQGEVDVHRRLGELLVDSLSRVTGEGFLYRVDMRLRPWGRDGMLVTTVQGYLSYLERYAQLWEKQALIKARPVAGNLGLGHQVVSDAQTILFGLTEQRARADIRAMKQRTEDRLRELGRDWGEVKLGVGSIRDVEFVTQYLQLVNGESYPDVLRSSTLDALLHLTACGLLSAEYYRVLSDGYIFLRTIEHHLQLMEHQQTSSLPGDKGAIAQLAQRLGFEGVQAGERFVAQYQQHCAAIRQIYLRILGSEEMTLGREPPGQTNSSNMFDHVQRMTPSYETVFSPGEIKRHAILIEQLDVENLVEVEADVLENGTWRVTIVAYDYPGELSLICGLLRVFDFSIVSGFVFTYEEARIDSFEAEPMWAQVHRERMRSRDRQAKIVDVFSVKPISGPVSADVWPRYKNDLTDLLKMMHAGQRREARGKLAKRVAASLRDVTGVASTLYPVDIVVDNDVSDRYTILEIDALDTVGFLYEFTNALAMSRVYIAQMVVDSVGNRVQDTLFVTDEYGRKITSPEKQRELRAATVLIKHFTHLLPHSSNPETALAHFREFLAQLFQRPDWPDELTSLERHEVLGALAKLLGVSDFLWDDFLRMQYANLFPVVKDVDDLVTVKSKERLQVSLDAMLQASDDDEQRIEILNAFKDREMFRIDMRHILGHISEFGQFSAELSDLAEVVVEAAYQICWQRLVDRHGLPVGEDGSENSMVFCGLGKFGGRELGFASDIELMCIFDGSGQTMGLQVTTTAEFYERLVQDFLGAIRSRQEGIFNIDLQLRPYGRAGSMAVSLEAFRRYFSPQGEAWPYERQALIKLRPVAGSTRLGRKVIALRDEYVYSGEAYDVAAMRAMRERQIRHLVHGGTFNAKHSPGGLVDAEYMVQALQMIHGHNNPSLRLAHTGQAMAALAAAHILPNDDYVDLREALIFLRRLINALRMVRGNARDLTVPQIETEEFSFLARRLGYEMDVDKLQADLTRYSSRVQELSYQNLS